MLVMDGWGRGVGGDELFRNRGAAEARSVVDPNILARFLMTDRAPDLGLKIDQAVPGAAYRVQDDCSVIGPSLMARRQRTTG